MIMPFTPGDTDEVNTVALEAFAQYQGTFSDWEVLTRGVGAMASLAADAEIIVARQDDGKLVGAVAYVPPRHMPRADFFDSDWPIIRMLVVNPAARGLGLGRKLTQACIDRAQRDGAAVIALHTSPAMAAALGLYLRMDFKLAKQVPDRFGVAYGVYLKDLTAREEDKEDRLSDGPCSNAD